MDTSAQTSASHGVAHQRSGLAVLIAGVAILIGSLASAAVEWMWVAVLVGFLSLAYGIAGVRAYQAPADGAVGKWGALLIRFGAVLMVILGLVFLVWEAVGTPPEEGPGVIDVAWLLGFAAFGIGVVLFAIGIIKARVLPAASGALMLIGFLAAIAIDMATGAFFEDEPETTEWGFYIGVPLFALGLAWAGYTVWKDRGSRSAVPARGEL